MPSYMVLLGFMSDEFRGFLGPRVSGGQERFELKQRVRVGQRAVIDCLPQSLLSCGHCSHRVPWGQPWGRNRKASLGWQPSQVRTGIPGGQRMGDLRDFRWRKSAASRKIYEEQKMSLANNWPVQENCSIIKNGYWKLGVRNDLDVRNPRANTIKK